MEEIISSAKVSHSLGWFLAYYTGGAVKELSSKN